MTSRIQYRQHFNRVVGYALKRDKRPEVIASTLAAKDTRGMIAEMEALRNKSTRCKQPVAHLVLSIKEGERLSDGQWDEAASRVAEAFGMEQFIAVRHNDTGCDHLHLIGNRVRGDGKTWSTSNDRFKMRSLCQDLERYFNITETPSRSHRSRVNKDELEKAERLYKEGKRLTAIPARMKLAEDIKATLTQARSPQDFETQLRDKKISTRWRHDREGRPIGVSFARGEAAISGRNAGISCRAIMVHFNEVTYEQNRSFTTSGPATRMAGAIGTGDRYTTPRGFAETDAGHRRAEQSDTPDDRGATGHGGSHPEASGIIADAAQVSGQLMTAALDRLIRDIDVDGRDGKGAPEAHPSRILRRVLRTPRKQPQKRPSR